MRSGTVMRVTQIRISEAAELLGVSDDTVRRWVEAGRLTAHRDGGPLTVDGASLAAFMVARSADPAQAIRQSARNRLSGLITRVEKDGVMALVEIQAGPHRITSLLTRESAEELGLEPGMRAAGVIKSTNVIVEVEG